MGLFGALGAIAPGLTDWRDRYGFERRVGLNHALFNASATILSLVSFLLRLIAGPGDRIAAAIAGFVRLVCVIYAGYLGCELVFAKGTGVNHTAWEWEAADEDDDEAVLPLERVEEHTRYRVTAYGVPVVLQGQVRSSLPSQRRVPMLVARWMKERSRVSRGMSLA